MTRSPSSNIGEVTSFRWDQVDLNQGLMHVNRLKNGHPIRGPELWALRRLQKEYEGPYVFSTERLGPLTTATVRKLMARAGEQAKLPPTLQAMFAVLRESSETRVTGKRGPT